MAAKRRNLFLYLALACFFGIIAIFIFDGYMGVYDTIHIKSGERERTIEPEDWLRHPYTHRIGAEWREKVFFRYEVDNRRFSNYSTPIQASVWKENEKVLELFSKGKSIGPFDEASVKWTLDTKQLKSRGFGREGKRPEEFTIKIKRKGVERKIIVGFHYPAGAEKEMPLPPKAPEKLR